MGRQVQVEREWKVMDEARQGHKLLGRMVSIERNR